MKKNIVILVSSMNMGGAQRVVSILSNNFSQDKHSVTLVHTFSGKQTNFYHIDKDVNVVYLNNNPFLPKNKVVNQFWKMLQLRKLIKSRNPSVVISFLTRVNIAAVLSTLGTKFPLVICERSWPPFKTINTRYIWALKILLKRVNKFVAQTSDSADWFHQNMPGSNVSIIPNPTLYPLPIDDDNLINPYTIVSPNKKVILACGRLHKNKQFNILIKAFTNLVDIYPDWNLVILGDGEEKDNLNRMVVDFGVTDRVCLPGSAGNISEWYERADLFVLSSLVEGFPNVLLEAMTHGLPCISFDCKTGPIDMIENGVSGILVNPDDKDLGLTNAMDKIISNQEFRHKIANNSVLLRDKYTIRSIIKKWNKVLDIQ
jgi:glycosyltransferase involved in cell wall biosynthesis